MKKGESTRSGMLWEVERILDECKVLNTLPNILFMENVPEVIGKNNIKDFQKWIEKLESLGYSNYVECLNSKDYGVPQNRNRCFMISILGEYTYKFPQPFELKLRLKDLLESNVDEKYYLSDKMVKYITADNEKWTGNNGKALINKKVASTLNTNEGSRRCDASNYICEELPEEYDLKNKALKETLETNDLKEFNIIDSYNRNIREDGICITLTTRTNASNNTFICVAESTKKGMIQTLKTSPSWSNLRIRKLTPRECFRLMGVKDEDFDKIKNNQSDSSLYHLAGDSIVVDVMYYMFKNLF